MNDKPEDEILGELLVSALKLVVDVVYLIKDRKCGAGIDEQQPSRKLPKCSDEQKGNAVHRSSKGITPTDKGCRRRKKKK